MSQEEHFVTKGEPVIVRDDVTEVSYRKIFTPAGERLEIEGPNVGFRIRLDAMALETLAWQDHEKFQQFVEEAGDRTPGSLDDRLEAMREASPVESLADADRSEPIKVTNEFAEAHVRHGRGPEGDLVEITAPKLGYRIVLTPTELESVTWQEPETFTEFLETPFGPDDHH